MGKIRNKFLLSEMYINDGILGTPYRSRVNSYKLYVPSSSYSSFSMKLLVILLLTISCAYANNQDYGYALFLDIKHNFDQYINLFVSGSQIEIPDVIGYYYQQIGTYTDDSFSDHFSTFEVSEVTQAVAQLPWYEERLSSTLLEALAKNFDNSTITSTHADREKTTSRAESRIPSFFEAPSYAYNKSRSSLKETTNTGLTSIYKGSGFDSIAPPVLSVTLLSFMLLLL